MKNKLLLLLTVLILSILAITLVSAVTDSESNANDILNHNYSQDEKSDNKILIVYFSRTGENYNVGNVDVGNTAMIASYIKEYLHADSYEIVPVNKYPENYDECTEVAQKEKDENARPEIQDKIENFDEYDTIFIGYPIWWGDVPMIMNTFMEGYDFNGKNVILFNTHEGSQDAGTYQKIQSKLSTANVNTNGLAIDGKTARTDEGKQKTIDWLKELGY